MATICRTINASGDDWRDCLKKKVGVRKDHLLIDASMVRYHVPTALTAPELDALHAGYENHEIYQLYAALEAA